MKDIIDKSKCPRTTAQRYFPSKEFIIVKLHDIFWSEILTTIDAVDDSTWDDNAVEKISKIIFAIQLFISRELQLIKAVSKVSPPPPHLIKSEELKAKRLEVRKKHRSFLRIMDGIISDGQKKGYILKTLPARLIRQILIGSFEKIASDLYLSDKNNVTEEESLFYTGKEARKAIDFVFLSICTGKNKEN